MAQLSGGPGEVVIEQPRRAHAVHQGAEKAIDGQVEGVEGVAVDVDGEAR
jgi:hypothetical protein